MHLAKRGAHMRLCSVMLVLISCSFGVILCADRQWRTKSASDTASADPAASNKAKQKQAKPSKSGGDSKVDLSSLPIPVPKMPYPVVTDHSFEVRNYWDEVRTASATDNQFRVEVRSKDGSVKGVSVWLDANNETHKTYFVADKKGYRVVPENVFKPDLPKQIEPPAVDNDEGEPSVIADAESSSPPRLRIPDALLGYIAARNKAAVLTRDSQFSDLVPTAADGVIHQAKEQAYEEERLLDGNLLADESAGNRKQRHVEHNVPAAEAPAVQEKPSRGFSSIISDQHLQPVFYRPIRLVAVPPFVMQRSQRQQQQNPVWPLFDPSLAYLLGTGFLNQVYFPTNPPYPWYFGARYPAAAHPLTGSMPNMPPSAGLSPQSFAEGPGISQIPPGGFGNYGPVYPQQRPAQPDTPHYEATVSITRPMSQAVAGPEGEAEAVAEGQAVGGPGASALALPQAVSIAGPGGIAVATTFATSNALGAGFGLSTDSVKRLSSQQRPNRPSSSSSPILGGAFFNQELIEEVKPAAPPAGDMSASASSSASEEHNAAHPSIIEFSKGTDGNSRAGAYSAMAPAASVLPRRTFFSLVQQGDVFNIQQQHGPQFFYAYNFA